MAGGFLVASATEEACEAELLTLNLDRQLLGRDVCRVRDDHPDHHPDHHHSNHHRVPRQVGVLLEQRRARLRGSGNGFVVPSPGRLSDRFGKRLRGRRRGHPVRVRSRRRRQRSCRLQRPRLRRCARQFEHCRRLRVLRRRDCWHVQMRVWRIFERKR